jgi:PPOX class probable FMN-dependent enzyme
MMHAPKTLELADLDRLYPAPKGRTLAKVIDHIDKHARRFIELSPFCVLASVGGDGTVDASPRGGAPGFVRVEGPRRLLMPDRPGNNRLDSFRNLLSGSGEVGMLFFVPGIDDCLRLNGRATLSDDPALLASLVEFGRPPRIVVEIAVREVYLHCPKAMMRARIWDAETHLPREALPSLGEMIRDQTGIGEAETTAEAVARYKDQL